MNDEKLVKLDYGYDILDYYEIVEDIYDKINTSVNLILSNKHLFKFEDFMMYNIDEYTLDTNNDIYAPINIYVCLNKMENRKKIENKFSKTEAPSMHYELARFRDDLYNTLIQQFDSSYLFRKDKYGIKISNEEYLKEFNAKGITYYIIPCIGYKNKNGKEGVIYYTNNRKYIDIDYPVLFGQNFVNKDIETDGLLTAYSRIFKNLYMKYYKVEDVPFVMFETLLYNVPSNMYTEISFKNAKSIIEYLLDKDIKTLKTVDEQDLQFNSKYKSLSRLYAKRLIKTMQKLLNNPNHKVFN